MCTTPRAEWRRFSLPQFKSAFCLLPAARLRSHFITISCPLCFLALVSMQEWDAEHILQGMYWHGAQLVSRTTYFAGLARILLVADCMGLKFPGSSLNFHKPKPSQNAGLWKASADANFVLNRVIMIVSLKYCAFDECHRETKVFSLTPYRLINSPIYVRSMMLSIFRNKGKKPPHERIVDIDFCCFVF